MSQSARTQFSEDGPEPTRELAFVGAERAEGAEPDPVAQRRPPLPTLHLAAHEIHRFAPPDAREPDPEA